MIAKRILSFFVAILMLFLCACSHGFGKDSPDIGSSKLNDEHKSSDSVGNSESLMLLSSLTKSKVKGRASNEDFSSALIESSFDYFSASIEDGKAKGNILISPLSLYIALAMTACGADGETLSQMQEILGDLPIEEAAHYLYALDEDLTENELIELEIANSLWIRDDKGAIEVNPDFVEVLDDYFDADSFMEGFDDKTVKKINAWIEDNTDGMIKEMLKEIPENAVMYLINALVFEADWQEAYDTMQLRESEFLQYNGEKAKTELMYSDEAYYLVDENAQGFIKPYADSRYAFVALLPNSGVDVYDYAKSLTGEGFSNLLASREKAIVSAAMPRFSYEYDDSFVNELRGLGMVNAFDERADLTGLGRSQWGNIYISDVLHKTFIEVSPKGTKAGAATVVEAVAEGAMVPIDLKHYQVYLDRSFVYAITDLETGIPLFLGVLANLD